MSSLVKYRIREVAADFGMTPKEVSEIVGKYFEKPKSNTQVLEDAQLNVVFEYITRQNQVASLEQVVAATAKDKRPAPAAEKPQDEKPAAKQPAAQAQAPASQAAPAKQSEKKPQEPQRKRERRVVDTSAVTVNADRFDDRVDSLISERAQNFSGGKQRIGSRNSKKPQKQGQVRRQQVPQ